MFNNKFFLFQTIFFNDFFFFVVVILFFGFLGVFIVKENFILILICLEMIFLAVILLLVFAGLIFDDFFGQLCCLVFLTVAAVESSVALALFVVYYRVSGYTNLSFVGTLKG